MTNKTNIVTEKVAQYKVLDLNKEATYNVIGCPIKIYCPKNVIVDSISNIYFDMYYNGIFGQYGYSEDKDFGRSLKIEDIVFRISDFILDNGQLFCNIDFLNTEMGKYAQSICNDLTLNFSAFFKFKNKLNKKRINKVDFIYFNDFYLVNK